MLTLASMIWAAYMFVGSELKMTSNVPCPVVIAIGKEYKYNEIEDAIYVPVNWTDTCYNQTQVVYYMAQNFNNFKNGKQKISSERQLEIAKKWVCIK